MRKREQAGYPQPPMRPSSSRRKRRRKRFKNPACEIAGNIFIKSFIPSDQDKDKEMVAQRINGKRRRSESELHRSELPGESLLFHCLRSGLADGTKPLTCTTLDGNSIANQYHAADASKSPAPREAAPRTSYRYAPNRPTYRLAPSSAQTWTLFIAVITQLSSQLSLAATSNYPVEIPNRPFDSSALNNKSLQRQFNNSSNTDDANEVLLQTNRHGIFRGILLAGDNDMPSVAGFLGIRYASAPIKKLRFMPPTAFHYAAGQVHEARSFGPICRQLWPAGIELAKYRGSGGNYNNDMESQISLLRRLMPMSALSFQGPLLKQLLHDHEQSEDCLNLNVYAPLEAITTASDRVITSSGADNKSLLLPVLVVIHGDSFDFGSGSTIDGAKLIRAQKQLLVVTLNYRLNLLGFPPKLTGASRGNLGLMDQIAALHWLRDNARSFGGDPANVTLLGTKRGAIFVNLLMLSPLAKGLFQRAILEDSSALTPLIGNQMSQASSRLSPPLPSPPSIQYIRLLTKLCDCPPAKSLHPQNSSENGGTYFAGSDHYHEQSSRESNMMIFDCLRNKPVEQIMQKVPLNLVHLTPDNMLKVNPRLLKKYPKLITQIVQQTKDSNASSIIDADSNEVDLIVTPDQVNKLINFVTKSFLEQTKNRQSTDPPLIADDYLELGDLFDSIYMEQSPQSIHSLFEPIIDGIIIPDEDLASLMLKQGPNSFAQKDLLIGFSRATLSSSSSMVPQFEDGSREKFAIKLRANHLLNSKISEKLERSGLTNEQAVDMVNLFVKSFYRYHNQEITNSIINNYLTNNMALNNKRLANPSTRKSSVDKGEERKLTATDEKQLIVLNALWDAFQDALISNPVIKTAIIHATKQVELLAEPFLGQQFEKWKRNSTLEANTIDQNQLLDSFIVFGQTLLSDPSWPLELRSPDSSNQQAILQPKATYLYELDLAILTDKLLSNTLIKLEKESISNREFSLMKENLKQLSSTLEQQPRLLDRLSISCLMDSTLDSILNGEESHLPIKFFDWLCTKFGRVLGDFVKFGNVNKQPNDSHSTKAISAFDFGKYDQFLANCYHQGDKFIASDHHSIEFSTETREDPQTSTNQRTTKISKLNDACKKELDSLTFEYLIQELESDSSKIRSSDNHWLVFNLFNQQFATLPGNYKFANQWLTNQLTSSELNSPTSIVARSSFWSNYIPAYNCTKTQPINPLSLIGDQLTASHSSNFLNSTLLNINLLFDCQQRATEAQPKTAHEMIEQLVSSLRGQLQAKIQDYMFRMNTNGQSAQNHHSLRMANISQSGSDLEGGSEQTQQESSSEMSASANNDSHLDFTFKTSSVNERDTPEQKHQVNFLTDKRIRYLAAITLVVCGLIISFTLASGACAIMNKKRRQSQQNGRRASSSPETTNHTSEHVIGRKSSDQGEESSARLDLACKNAIRLSHEEATLQNNHLVYGANSYGSHQATSHVYPLEHSTIVVQDDLIEVNQNPATDYWTTTAASELPIGANLCRSRSSLSTSNNSTIVDNKHPQYPSPNSNNNGLNSPETIELEQLVCSDQDPRVLLSIVTPSSYASNCVGTNGNSSSETTTQNHSSLSCSSNQPHGHLHGSNKKRVKISENLPYKVSTLNSHRKRQDQQSIPRGSQLQLYCPIHHHQMPNQQAPRHQHYNSTLTLGDNYYLSTANDLSLVGSTDTRFVNGYYNSQHQFVSLAPPNNIIDNNDNNCDAQQHLMMVRSPNQASSSTKLLLDQYGNQIPNGISNCVMPN